MTSNEKGGSGVQPPNMAELAGRLALKYSPTVSHLRRIPLLGRLLHRVSALILPREHRVWVRLEQGAGQGLWLKLNPRTQSGFYTHERDLALREIMNKHLRPGMVFYDLGANLGLFSLIGARLVGAGGSVFAFEPEPGLARRIAEHAVRNQCPNVSVVESAVWSNSGLVSFDRGESCSSSDFGLGKVNPEYSPNQDGRTIRVSCLALDDFASRHRPPHFIKCDVEGAEVEAFKGAHRILAEHKPIVECEVHSRENGEALTDLFRRKSYSLDWYTEGHFLASPAV